jgi:hypothetical protein
MGERQKSRLTIARARSPRTHAARAQWYEKTKPDIFPAIEFALSFSIFLAIAWH